MELYELTEKRGRFSIEANRILTGDDYWDSGHPNFNELYSLIEEIYSNAVDSLIAMKAIGKYLLAPKTAVGEPLFQPIFEGLLMAARGFKPFADGFVLRYLLPGISQELEVGPRVKIGNKFYDLTLSQDQEEDTITEQG